MQLTRTTFLTWFDNGHPFFIANQTRVDKCFPIKTQDVWEGGSAFTVNDKVVRFSREHLEFRSYDLRSNFVDNYCFTTIDEARSKMRELFIELIDHHNHHEFKNNEIIVQTKDINIGFSDEPLEDFQNQFVVKPLIIQDGDNLAVYKNELNGRTPISWGVWSDAQTQQWLADLPTEKLANDFVMLVNRLCLQNEEKEESSVEEMIYHVCYNTTTQENEGAEYMSASEAEQRNAFAIKTKSKFRWIIDKENNQPG